MGNYSGPYSSCRRGDHLQLPPQERDICDRSSTGQLEHAESLHDKFVPTLQKAGIHLRKEHIETSSDMYKKPAITLDRPTQLQE